MTIPYSEERDTRQDGDTPLPCCKIWMDHGSEDTPVTTAMFVAQRPQESGCIPRGPVGSGMLAKELACSCQVPAYANSQPGRGWHGWHRADTQPTVESIPYPDACHGQIGTQTCWAHPTPSRVGMRLSVAKGTVTANTNYLPAMSLRNAVVCGRDSDSPRRPISSVMRP